MKRFIIFIIIAITFIGQSGAQTVDLTNEEIEVIKSRIVNKLEDFQYFLGIIADKRNSTNVRQNALNSNINLFIGKCEPYQIRNDWDGSLITNDAVKMQVSSRYRSKPKQEFMKSYLNRLYKGMGYANIRIEKADAIRVDNFRKTPDGKYLAVAHIVQDFIGYNENGSIRYSDRTEKTVIIHINIHEIITDFGNEIIVDNVLLDDMNVTYI